MEKNMGVYKSPAHMGIRRWEKNHFGNLQIPTKKCL